MSEQEPPSGGLFASAKRLLTTAVALFQNRLEIFSLELEEEKIRLIDVLLWAAVTVLLGALALIIITFTIILLFWEDPTQRLVASGILTLIYIAGAIFAGAQLRKRVRGSGTPFDQTLQALKKDISCLSTRD